MLPETKAEGERGKNGGEKGLGYIRMCYKGASHY